MDKFEAASLGQNAMGLGEHKVPAIPRDRCHGVVQTHIIKRVVWKWKRLCDTKTRCTVSGVFQVQSCCSYVYAQVVRQQLRVLCDLPGVSRLYFLGGKWDINSGDGCPVGFPRLRSMRDPVAVPAAKFERITNGG